VPVSTNDLCMHNNNNTELEQLMHMPMQETEVYCLKTVNNGGFCALCFYLVSLFHCRRSSSDSHFTVFRLVSDNNVLVFLMSLFWLG